MNNEEASKFQNSEECNFFITPLASHGIQSFNNKLSQFDQYNGLRVIHIRFEVVTMPSLTDIWKM